MNQFGEFIRNLRLKCGFGLREAANMIGIQAPYLSRIEAGRDNPPSLNIIKQMAKIYNTDLEIIIDQAKDRAAEVYGEEVVDNPALYGLFKLARQMDEETLIDAIKKVCKESNIDPNKFLDEIQKRKKDMSGPQFSRRQRQDESLFPVDIRPRFLSKRDIALMACKILERFYKSKENYEPPTPIEKIAEQIEGIRLRMDLKLENFRNGKPWQLGLSNWSPEGYREIHINNSLLTDKPTDERRLRFTVAHELFHCIEHLKLMTEKDRQVSAFSRLLLEAPIKINEGKELERNAYVEQWVSAPNKPRMLRTNDDWREWQSDYFAACILMPEWSVRKEFQKRTGVKEVIVEESALRRTADQIARDEICPNGVFEKTLYQLYDVSVRAMAIRLMVLQLVRS